MTAPISSGSSPAGDRLGDPVTGHLRTDVARLPSGATVGGALDTIREKPPQGRIIYFYVTDEDGRLAGVVPTRRLLMSRPDTPISDVMLGRVIAIPHTATVLEACEFFILHRLLAFPIVDDDRKLLGVVDVEVYTDELIDLERDGTAGAGSGDEGPNQHDDLFQLIGVHLEDARQKSSVSAFRTRFPWLLTNVAGGLLAAALSGLFRAELEKAVALALFIPVVLALAESVSIQSVSLALQSLRGRTPTVSSILKRLRRESATGVLLGAGGAVLVGGVALVWLGQPHVAAALFGGIAGGVTCAAVLGTAIPNLLRLLRREPQVAAGPIALAATDMVTLLIYLSLARWLIG